MYNNHTSIKTWADDDRPREKLILKGRHNLSDAEILAIIIGSGTRNQSAVDVSREILSHVANDFSKLSKLSVKDLMKFNGIGEAKAVSIVAAMEIGRRRKEIENLNRRKVSSSSQVYQLLRPVFCDLMHEEFHVIFLNTSNIILHQERVGQGGITGTVADGKIIFKMALQHNATGLIIAHNHPSGNLNPSESDIFLTKNLKKFGELINIKILDHLIMTDEKYFSFADHGVL